MALLPTERIHLIATASPETLRARLRSASAQPALERPKEIGGSGFRGTVADRDFVLRPRLRLGLAPRPVVRGTIREWEGGSAIDAEVSVSGDWIVETGIAVVVLLSLLGLPATGPVLALAGVGGYALHRAIRRDVQAVAVAFRGQVESLTDDRPSEADI